MGILSGVVSYLFGLALNLLDAAINGFLSALGFDLDTFEKYFPAARHFNDIIIGFAVGLLFIMLIFQIFRNFGVVLDMEVEDPLKMLGKTMLFFGMIMYSRSITNIIVNLLTDPYAIFLNTATSPYEFKLLTLVTAMFTSVFSNPFMAIVALILMLVLGWQFLKLTIECVERYIVFCFVLYCAPVVFATGAFKSTAQILKSWCRMLMSQALLLLLNIWSIKLFLSYLPVLESDSNNIVFNFLIGYAFLKFAQKADSLLRILGLNTASTGDMVRSLGGTIASIALAVKTASHAAGSVKSAAGKIFGGGTSSPENAANGGKSNTIGGMGTVAGNSGFNNANNGSQSGQTGTAGSGMGTAKQAYVNEVLGSAKSQLNSNFDNIGDFGDNSGSEKTYENNPPAFGGKSGADRNVEMIPDGARSKANGQARIDIETQEGLANIAHGLPHNKYNRSDKSYSGGGFPEFTGEEANIIGSSQLTAADGFEQHGVKLPDGSTGTLYQNSETGEAHLVQFGSVDNGVIQGAISEIDRDTGQFGDFMAFKAVHQSVPGTESFSKHSVPVSDSEGGVYHVSTGASTSFFSAGSGSVMNKAAGEAPQLSANAIHTSSDTDGSATMATSHEASTIHTSSIGNSVISAPISDSISTTAIAGISDSASISRESRSIASKSADSLAANTVMAQHNDERRFSKNNPANLEVFGRENGSVESFNRATAPPDSIPKMDSSIDK